jgi:hypothetical protein
MGESISALLIFYLLSVRGRRMLAGKFALINVEHTRRKQTRYEVFGVGLRRSF